MGLLLLEGLVDVLGLVMCLVAGVFSISTIRKAGRKKTPVSFAECLEGSEVECDDAVSRGLCSGVNQGGQSTALDAGILQPKKAVSSAFAGGWTEKKMRAVRLAASGLEEEEIASKLDVSPVAVGLMLHAGIDGAAGGGCREKIAVQA